MCTFYPVSRSDSFRRPPPSSSPLSTYILPWSTVAVRRRPSVPMRARIWQGVRLYVGFVIGPCFDRCHFFRVTRQYSRKKPDHGWSPSSWGSSTPLLAIIPVEVQYLDDIIIDPVQQRDWFINSSWQSHDALWHSLMETGLIWFHSQWWMIKRLFSSLKRSLSLWVYTADMRTKCLRHFPAFTARTIYVDLFLWRGKQ